MRKEKRGGLSRRSFLKAATGVAVAGAGLSLPEQAQSAEDKRLATLIDLSLCDGCPGGAGLCLRLQGDQQRQNSQDCRAHSRTLAAEEGRGLVEEAGGIRPFDPL